MRYCRNCGNPLSDDAKFCGGCGNIVSEYHSDIQVQQKNGKFVNGRKKLNRGIKIGSACLLIVVALIGGFSILKYETIYVAVRIAYEDSENPDNSYYDIQMVDEKGNYIEEKRFNLDNSLECYWEFEYDDNGNRIEEMKYDAVGQHIWEESYKWEYDKNGNCIKSIWYNEDSQIRGYTVDEYNTDGNCTVSMHYNNDSLDSYHKFTYDANGNILEQIYCDIEDSMWSFSHNYIYDDDGYLKKELSYDGSEQLLEVTEYFYDDKGNCIQKKYTMKRII